MKCLVLGASGQVGAALMAVLKDRGHVPIGTYATHPSPGLIPFNLLQDDPLPLLKEVKPNLVFCPAGATHVDGCEENQVEARILNLEGPLRFAQTALPFHAKFIYYSTEYVFDGAAGPYAEDASPHPLSVYGSTKSQGESQILSLAAGSLAIRTTVIYGPDPQAKNTVYQLKKVIGGGGSFRSPKDQTTTPTYCPDLALASVILAERGVHGVIHVAGPEVCSRYDLALEACRAFGLDESKLSPCLTADLNQKARRPLRAGLLSPRVELLTGVRMRGTKEGLEKTKGLLDSGN